MIFSELKESIDAQKAAEPGRDNTGNLEMLLEIISKVNQSLNFDEVIELVIKNALKLTGFDKGCIFMYNPATENLEYKTGFDSNENTLLSESFQASHTVIKNVFKTGQSLFIEDALSDTDYKSCQSILSLELKTIFCSPLQNIKGKVGVLYVDSKKLHLIRGKAMTETFEIMAGQVTASIMNAQLYSDLQKLSKVYTKGVYKLMNGNRTRAAQFLGITTKKLDALLA